MIAKDRTPVTGPRIILHLGAHKTATTYLQRRLQTHSETLIQHGVVYVGPDTLRSANFGANLTGSIGRIGRARRIERAIKQAQRHGVARVVVSEENLLGPLAGTLSDFYPDPARELKRLDRAIAGKAITVLFGVRNYASFFASAYGHTLRSGRWSDFEAHRSSILAMRRGWPDVIQEIMAVLPGTTELRLWRFEDFRKLERRLLMELAGPEAAAKIKSANFRHLPGPSQAAIDHLCGLVHSGQRLDRQTVLKTYRTYQKTDGHRAFNPWAADAHAFLNARYQNDLSILAERWPSTILDAASQ